MRLIARGGGICAGSRSAPIGHLRALVPRAAWSDRNPGCALAFFILRWDTAKRQQRPTIARNEGESSLSIRSGGPSIRPVPSPLLIKNAKKTKHEDLMCLEPRKKKKPTKQKKENPKRQEAKKPREQENHTMVGIN